MNENVPPFSQLVLEELKRSDMSIRQLAQKMGVTHPTVARVVDGAQPTLEFVVAFAEASGLNPLDLLVMVFPDRITPVPSDAMGLAVRLSRLSAEQRQLVDRLIAGMLLQRPKEGPDS